MSADQPQHRRDVLHERWTADGPPAYSVAADVSTRIVRLMSQYTGRGPTKARTTLNTNFVLVVLEDTLTRGERSLVAAGEVEAVRNHRRKFQDVMRPEAIAAIEEVTGRHVRTFLSDMDPEAGVSIELFLLEPLPETGQSVVVETHE